MQRLRVLLLLLLLLLLPALPIGAQTFRLVTSLDEITGMNEYILASGPELKEGCHVAGKLSDKYKLEAVPFSADCPTWRIERMTGYFRILFGPEGSTYLTLIRSGLSTHRTDKNEKWSITPASGVAGQYIFQNAAAAEDHYALLFKEESWFFGYYSGNDSCNRPLYLFRRSDSPSVPAPAFATTQKRFAGSMEVAIRVPEGCRVFYTTDGTTPDPDRSIAYEGPFRLSATTTVRALCQDADGATSTVVTQTFERVAPIVVRFGGSAGIGTFFAPHETVLPSGVTAYTACGLEYDGTLRLTRYDAAGVLPDSVPFILQGRGMSQAEMVFSPTEGTAAPSYDGSLCFGTTAETPTPAASLTYALGYAEADPMRFGFCPYAGATLPAFRAFLRFRSPFVRPAAPPRVGEVWEDCVMATAGTADGRPAGIAWGMFNKKTGGIAPIALSAGEVPARWRLEGFKSGTKITCGSFRLAAKENETNNFSDGNTEDCKYRFWQLKVNPATGKTDMTTKEGDHHILYAKNAVYTNIKRYASGEGFFIFRPVKDGVSLSAPPFVALGAGLESGVSPLPAGSRGAVRAYSIDGKPRPHHARGLLIQDGRLIFRP